MEMIKQYKEHDPKIEKTWQIKVKDKYFLVEF